MTPLQIHDSQPSTQTPPIPSHATFINSSTFISTPTTPPTPKPLQPFDLFVKMADKNTLDQVTNILNNFNNKPSPKEQQKEELIELSDGLLAEINGRLSNNETTPVSSETLQQLLSTLTMDGVDLTFLTENPDPSTPAPSSVNHKVIVFEECNQTQEPVHLSNDSEVLEEDPSHVQEMLNKNFEMLCNLQLFQNERSLSILTPHEKSLFAQLQVNLSQLSQQLKPHELTDQMATTAFKSQILEQSVSPQQCRR